MVELDPDAEVVGFRVVEGVIRSAFRLSYEQAQEIILGLKPDHVLSETLARLNKWAKGMRETRFAQGSIDFDIQEVRVELMSKAVRCASCHANAGTPTS